MSIEIRQVVSKKDQKKFVKFPFHIYKDNKYWVPPIITGDRKLLIPEYNPAFEYCDAQFWIALKNKRVVGRIGAIINHKHNEKSEEKEGRFSRFECVNDKEVAAALFAIAEQWLKEKGITRVKGPLGFNNFDAQGLLIEGFDYLASIASVYHLPYYKELVEDNGYTKEIDWVEFRLTMADTLNPKAERLNNLIKKRYELKTISFANRKELKGYAPKIFQLLNIAFADLFSFDAFNQQSIDFYTRKYFSFLKPSLITAIEDKKGNTVGFLIPVPSMSRAMQKANGKLFPFGFLHILNTLKHNNTVDLFLTAVDPQKQGMGLPAILATESLKAFLASGIKYIETTGIFETNHKVITHWKEYEHIQHKRRRCYTKELK